MGDAVAGRDRCRRPHPDMLFFPPDCSEEGTRCPASKSQWKPLLQPRSRWHGRHTRRPKTSRTGIAASDDWHCPSASVDLREGGKFVSRMEGRDGGMGFDFGGTYTAIVPHEPIAYTFGGREAVV